VKIIARIDSNRLIVEMTEREIANIAGYSYESQLPHVRRPEEALRPGVEYKISPAWDRLRQQAEVSEKLVGVSKALAALSDLVTQTKVQFANATSEAPKAEGGAS